MTRGFERGQRGRDPQPCVRTPGHASQALGDASSGDHGGAQHRSLEGTAAAIIEFMLSALVENPHRVGGRLQREFAGLHSARRGAYRVVCEIDDDQHAVIVLRIDHRSSVYRML